MENKEYEQINEEFLSEEIIDYVLKNFENVHDDTKEDKKLNYATNKNGQQKFQRERAFSKILHKKVVRVKKHKNTSEIKGEAGGLNLYILVYNLNANNDIEKLANYKNNNIAVIEPRIQFYFGIFSGKFKTGNNNNMLPTFVWSDVLTYWLGKPEILQLIHFYKKEDNKEIMFENIGKLKKIAIVKKSPYVIINFFKKITEDDLKNESDREKFAPGASVNVSIAIDEIDFEEVVKVSEYIIYNLMPKYAIDAMLKSFSM